MQKTRIAIIGLGMASPPHALSLIDMKDQVEVATAYSQTETRRAAFATRFGLPVTGDLSDIFADPTIEAVLVLTPPNTHRELVSRAADVGKHVLLEKPLEIDIEQAQAVVDIAESARIKLGVVFQNRFRPVNVALAEIIAQDRLGATVSVSARLSNWRPQSYYDEPGRGTKSRDGGGVLLTQGIHTLDLLISLTGLPVEVSAYCKTTPIHNMETEDLAVAIARYGNGAVGSISATTCAYPGFPDEIDIVGAKGMARLNGTQLSAHFHDGSNVKFADETKGDGSGANPMAFSHQPHKSLIADFLQSIREDRAPKISGRDALNAHRLVSAILRSSETGEPTTV